MPKNSRGGSRGRKPLVDISNGSKMARTSKKDAHRGGGVGRVGPRDRLLHARSDLSKLIKQVDELVVQALEHKFTIEKNQEIEAFIHVLSDMHSSLEPWVPRFKQAFSCLVVGPGNESELSLYGKTFPAIDGGKKLTSNGPSEPELGLIVSPSPLVSWRNGACTVETGRQLFLLTPLHKSKSIAPKFSGSSKCSQGGLNNKNGSCGTLGLATFSNAPCSNCGDLKEKVDGKQTPNKFLVPGTGASDGMSKTNLVSLAKISNCKDGFICGLSPYVKTSPMRTCFLLNPVSDFIQQDNRTIRKGTPWVDRTQRNEDSSVFDTLSSDKYSQNCEKDEISVTLTSKYPELFGLPPRKSTVQGKEVDETLDWFLSPPKTCVLLMEPLDEKVIHPSGTEDKHPLNSGSNNSKLTPMWKNLESATANGKNAGEATLKRELWTKFEAVSMNGLQFDHSIFKQIPRNRFLDMLEEVS